MKTLRDFVEWFKNSDDVVQMANGFYYEQTTQYQQRFTLTELYQFFINEYVDRTI